MGTLLRPHIKELFINVPRRIEIGFHTSSLDKFLQARMVLQEFGLRLRHFISSQDPYREDYSQTEEELLTSAINEVRHRLGVESLFFVEDTSLRIEALSSEKEDIPGPAVKEWFAQTEFSDLDQELRKRGRGREAIVRSDIALHVPRLPVRCSFTARQTGQSRRRRRRSSSQINARGLAPIRLMAGSFRMVRPSVSAKCHLRSHGTMIFGYGRSVRSWHVLRSTQPHLTCHRIHTRPNIP